MIENGCGPSALGSRQSLWGSWRRSSANLLTAHCSLLAAHCSLLTAPPLARGQALVTAHCLLPVIDPDRIRGALLGLALGDALGAPVNGMSHQSIRTHVRGMKGLETAGPRGIAAPGVHTARALALARTLAGDGDAAFELPAGAGAAACAAPAGVVAFKGALDDVALVDLLKVAGGPDVESFSAAVGQARAIALVLATGPEVDAQAFLRDVALACVAAGAERVPETLLALADHLEDTPLDLHDRAGGTGDAADQAFPFAAAMFAREPALVEATLLSAINVGGATSATGAIAGALLGAFNGWTSFPDEWRAGLPGAVHLITEADLSAGVPGG